MIQQLVPFTVLKRFAFRKGYKKNLKNQTKTDLQTWFYNNSLVGRYN